MAKIFNFYQFVTGVTGLSGLAVVNPLFENLLTGSGLYTPDQMINTPETYRWLINNEYLFYPPSYQIQVNAALASTNVNALTSLPVFSGKFFPVSSGNLSLSPIISGNITQGSFDTYTFITPFSGAITGIPLDSGIFNIIISGSQIGEWRDPTNFYSPFSGAISGQPLEIATFNIIFSGGIVKYQRDSSSIDISLESISWTKGSPVQIQNISGQNIIDITLEAVYWSTSD